jgi:hypothetical protein
VGEGRIDAMKPILLSLVLTLPLCSQQLIFARQAVIGKKSRIELWAVSGLAPSESRPPSAATVYALAMKHGVSFLDDTVAEARLAAKDGKSLTARVFAWGSYFEIGATELVNLHVIQANTQVALGLNIAMGLVNAFLPSVQKGIPAPDPAVLAKVRSGSLLMDSQGSLSGFFFAEQSGVQSFLETVP